MTVVMYLFEVGLDVHFFVLSFLPHTLRMNRQTTHESMAGTTKKKKEKKCTRELRVVDVS